MLNQKVLHQPFSKDFDIVHVSTVQISTSVHPTLLSILKMETACFLAKPVGSFVEKKSDKSCVCVQGIKV